MDIIKSLSKVVKFIIYITLAPFFIKVYLRLINSGEIFSLVFPILFTTISAVVLNYEIVLTILKEKLGKVVINISLVLTCLLFVFLMIYQFIILPTIPYDYLGKLNNKSVIDELPIDSQKFYYYAIPEDVSKRLGTEPLLVTILDNRFLLDLFNYDDFTDGVEQNESRFRILEFLSKKDALKILDEYIILYQVKLEENETKFDLSANDLTEKIEILIEDKDIVEIDNISKEELEVINCYLKLSFMKMLKENYNDILK